MYYLLIQRKKIEVGSPIFFGGVGGFDPLPDILDEVFNLII